MLHIWVLWTLEGSFQDPTVLSLLGVLLGHGLELGFNPTLLLTPRGGGLSNQGLPWTLVNKCSMHIFIQIRYRSRFTLLTSPRIQPGKSNSSATKTNFPGSDGTPKRGPSKWHAVILDLVPANRNGPISQTTERTPGRPAAYNCGLLWLFCGLLWGIVAFDFRPLGVPGTGSFRVHSFVHLGSPG